MKHLNSKDFMIKLTFEIGHYKASTGTTADPTLDVSHLDVVAVLWFF